MGSTVFQGMPPCPWLPVMRIFSMSLAAVVAPVRQLTCPSGPGITCMAKIASGLSVSNRPSSSIFFAPQLAPGPGCTRLEPSSAGWKINITVPSS